jgi:hypothetical protein
MPAVKQEPSQVHTTFVERPIELFKRDNSLFGTLLTRYSGFKLMEEACYAGFMTRPVQIYYFGNEQIFWSPRLRVHPLFTHNQIESTSLSSLSYTVEEQTYSILSTIILTTKSEVSETKTAYQDFLSFEFYIANLSNLDKIIFSGNIQRLRVFLKENQNNIKNLLDTIPRLQIVSTPSIRFSSQVLVFNVQSKEYIGTDVARRRLVPVTNYISTLDLAILSKSHNPEIYTLLITEFVLSLNTDPRAIEQLIEILKSQASYFDAMRQTSNAITYLKNLIEESIKRNGEVRVERWLEDSELPKKIPEPDRKSFKEYLDSRFTIDDEEKQLITGIRNIKKF